jgi:hypothetical protein
MLVSAIVSIINFLLVARGSLRHFEKYVDATEIQEWPPESSRRLKATRTQNGYGQTAYIIVPIQILYYTNSLFELQ